MTTQRMAIQDGRDERGSVAPFAVAVLGTLLFTVAALGVVAAMVAAHRTAQAGADLAALAGARAVQHGADGCQAAAGIAEANRTTLASCEVTGEDVRVVVSARGPSWLGQTGDLKAEARAGPATVSSAGMRAGMRVGGVPR